MIIYAAQGAITQLVECHNGIVKATGSSPVSSIFTSTLKNYFCVIGSISFPLPKSYASSDTFQC